MTDPFDEAIRRQDAGAAGKAAEDAANALHLQRNAAEVNELLSQFLDRVPPESARTMYFEGSDGERCGWPLGNSSTFTWFLEADGTLLERPWLEARYWAMTGHWDDPHYGSVRNADLSRVGTIGLREELAAVLRTLRDTQHRESYVRQLISEFLSETDKTSARRVLINRGVGRFDNREPDKLLEERTGWYLAPEFGVDCWFLEVNGTLWCKRWLNRSPGDQAIGTCYSIARPVDIAASNFTAEWCREALAILTRLSKTGGISPEEIEWDQHIAQGERGWGKRERAILMNKRDQLQVAMDQKRHRRERTPYFAWLAELDQKIAEIDRTCP